MKIDKKRAQILFMILHESKIDKNLINYKQSTKYLNHTFFIFPNLTKVIKNYEKIQM